MSDKSKAKTGQTPKQTLSFQSEVKQLLHLMIHSLYSNKEIFLRELISNASDAADKLRFAGIKKPDILPAEDLRIRIAFNSKANTVSITDNGIGMNRQEVVEHLGTIAKSGTGEFLSQLTGDQKKDTKLIGQFGVGFYSSFIVAERVEVFTRKAGDDQSQGVHWESTGEGAFDIENAIQEQPGTTVLLHLKKEEKEFASEFRLKDLIQKYSDHIPFPVEMQKEIEIDDASEAEDTKKDKTSDVQDDDLENKDKSTDQDKKDKKKEKPKKKTLIWEAVNKATALWTKPRNSIKDEEYKEFYKHIAHDFQEPLHWSHNQVEGKLNYTSLLYLPKHAPFDLYNRDVPRGLKLYIQRVFIMDNADAFLPLYLRFVKGVIDSNDLSLNVSRELLQKDAQVEKLKTALTKRILDNLAKIKKNHPEDYQDFWGNFGAVLKEGVAEDPGNKEAIAKLLLFYSTKEDQAKPQVSLEDYVRRMAPDQDKIYYLIAEQYEAAKDSPYLEIFRKKDMEVLLLTDRVDEWLVSYLFEFSGKKLQNITKGELDFDKDKKDADKKDASDKNEDKKDQDEAHKALLEKIKNTLEDKVASVRVTHRLVDSPACLVLNEYDMGAQMRKMMEAAGQKMPESKPVLEINPEHPLIKKLDQEIESQHFDDVVQVLFDQARLLSGEQLTNPAKYVARINKLLLALSLTGTI